MLRHLGLDKYIANENVPGVAEQGRDNQQRKLKYKGNGVKETPKMRFSGMGDAEMIHISRAMTAREMRDARIPHHIMMVKKSGGGLGTLATRIELYSATAE